MNWNPAGPGAATWTPTAPSVDAWSEAAPAAEAWTPEAPGAGAWSPDTAPVATWETDCFVDCAKDAIITGLWTFNQHIQIGNAYQLRFRDTDTYFTSGAAGYLDAHFKDDDKGMRFYSGPYLLATISRMDVGSPAHMTLNVTDNFNIKRAGVHFLQFWDSPLRLVMRQDVLFYGASAKLNDNESIGFGTGPGVTSLSPDAKIYYDTVNLIADPSVIGSGKLYIGPTANKEIVAEKYHVNTAFTEYMSSDDAGYLDAHAATAFRLTTTGRVVLTVPSNHVLKVAGDVFLIDSGSNPRLVLGDSTDLDNWGSIRWVSASDAIGIGTCEGGVDTLLVYEDGNARIAGTGQWQFGDAGTYIQQGADSYLDLVADGAIRAYGIFEIEATSTTTGHITQGGTRIFHTYGTGNTFIGEASGTFVAGTYNTAIGWHALDALTSGGGGNVGLGAGAGGGITSGDNNLCIGTNAGLAITTTGSNVCIGEGAYQRGTSTTVVAIGSRALYNATSAQLTVAIGGFSAYAQGTADRGIFIGYAAGFYETASDKLFIDNATRASEADGRVKALIYGEFAAATANQLVRVNGVLETLEGAKLGGNGVTDYTAFGADGRQTMHGDARVTKTIDFTGAMLERGRTAPTEVTRGNYTAWAYDINDDSIIDSFELPHDWTPGTNLTLELHWEINEAYASDKEVRFEVAWAACPDDESEALDGPTHTGTVTMTDTNIPATEKHFTKTVMGTISGASLSANDEIGLTLKRIALADGDNPTADPEVVHLHVVYISNSLGEAT